MDTILNVLMISFCVLGLIATGMSVMLMLIRPKMKPVTCSPTPLQPCDETYEKLLFQMNNASTPEEQGAAFIKMVERGDVPLHILKNKGNCYNDALQPQIYKEFLSQQSMRALLELEA